MSTLTNNTDPFEMPAISQRRISALAIVVVREVAGRLKGDGRVSWFHVTAENLESIHNHSAFAEIEWLRREEIG